MTPFATVGQTGKQFTLTALTPKAVAKVTADDLIGSISFQMLDAGGCTVDGSTRTWDGTKWTDDSGNDKSTEPYAPGVAIWTSNTSMNPSTSECGIVNMQAAGEVIQENVIADLDDDFGSVLIGNPFAVNIALSDIIPYVESGTIEAGSISFQKLDAGGCTVEGSTRTWDGTKWVDDNGADKSTETLNPGEAINVGNTNMDPSTCLCIPGKIRFVAPTF